MNRGALRICFFLLVIIRIIDEMYILINCPRKETPWRFLKISVKDRDRDSVEICQRLTKDLPRTHDENDDYCEQLYTMSLISIFTSEIPELVRNFRRRDIVRFYGFLAF